MSNPLNVTHNSDARDWRDWIGYVVLNGLAVRVASGCLDDLRYYAKREGYDGILIGAPSVPWARLQRA